MIPIQQHGCDIMMKESRCGEETVITLSTGAQLLNLCKDHYRAKIVDQFERERGTSSCNICKGIMTYINVTYDSNTKEIKSWYRCDNCRTSVGYNRVLNKGGYIE